VSALLKKAQKRKGDKRNAAGNTQGHQKTPAMVEAIVQDALAGRADGETPARGGFTDVGLHTGGHARNTSWPLVRAVVQVLLEQQGLHQLYRMAMAQFSLWETERRCRGSRAAMLGMGRANATVELDSIVEMLTAAALEGAALADDETHARHGEATRLCLQQFEARCALVRLELERTVRVRAESAARQYDLPQLASSDVDRRLPTLTLPPRKVQKPAAGGLDAAAIRVSEKVDRAGSKVKSGWKTLSPLAAMSAQSQTMIDAIPMVIERAAATSGDGKEGLGRLTDGEKMVCDALSDIARTSVSDYADAVSKIDHLLRQSAAINAMIRMLASANLGVLAAPLDGDAAWDQVLQWLENAAEPNTKTNDAATMLLLSSVERVFYTWAEKLRQGLTMPHLDHVALKEVIYHYRSVASAFRKTPAAQVQLASELRSHETLLAWIGFCLVYKAAAAWCAELAGYAPALDPSDLRYLVLSDKSAVDAALRVAAYLQQMRATGAPPVFSLRAHDGTFDFGRDYARRHLSLQWAKEEASSESRKARHWDQVQSQKKALCKLDSELAALGQQLANAEVELQQLPRITGQSTYAQDAAWRAANSLVTSLRRQEQSKESKIRAMEVPPSAILQPLPREEAAGLSILFFIDMPTLFRTLTCLSFSAQQTLLPREGVDEHIERESYVTSWLQYYSSTSTARKYTPAQTDVRLGSPSSFRKPRNSSLAACATSPARRTACGTQTRSSLVCIGTAAALSSTAAAALPLATLTRLRPCRLRPSWSSSRSRWLRGTADLTGRCSSTARARIQCAATRPRRGSTRSPAGCQRWSSSPSAPFARTPTSRRESSASRSPSAAYRCTRLRCASSSSRRCTSWASSTRT